MLRASVTHVITARSAVALTCDRRQDYIRKLKRSAVSRLVLASLVLVLDLLPMFANVGV